MKNLRAHARRHVGYAKRSVCALRKEEKSIKKKEGAENVEKMWKNEVLGMKKTALKIIAAILFIAICLIALAMDLELPKDSMLKTAGSTTVLALLAVLALVAGRLYG